MSLATFLFVPLLNLFYDPRTRVAHVKAICYE
jgi:hypothetical protein